jgi:hypothetical protein
MKRFCALTCVLFTLGTLSNIASADPTPVAPKCGQTVMYSAGGATLEEASKAFETELKILLNDCAVQDAVKSENTNFYIHSFSQKDGQLVVTYEKIVFAADGTGAEFDCKLVQTKVPVKEISKPGVPSSAVAHFAVTNKNECVDRSNPKGFVCQKGWIDCMPTTSGGGQKYCSDEFFKWSEKNCSEQPQIAM